MIVDILDRQPPDPLLNMIGLFRNDRRLSKLDLDVGVFRDDDGHTPVLESAKAAEQLLAAAQTTQAYLGPTAISHSSSCCAMSSSAVRSQRTRTSCAAFRPLTAPAR